jgi:hypothetical protein
MRGKRGRGRHSRVFGGDRQGLPLGEPVVEFAVPGGQVAELPYGLLQVGIDFGG